MMALTRFETITSRPELRWPRPNVVAGAILALTVSLAGLLLFTSGNPLLSAVPLVAGLLAMPAPRIAQQWERAIVLRFGRFVGLRGPGLFWILPFIDRISTYIDQRTITTSFAAEQTLTSDTVPVNVDAVLFWMVHDANAPRLRYRTMRGPSAGPHRPHCATSSDARH